MKLFVLLKCFDVMKIMDCFVFAHKTNGSLATAAGGG